MTDIRISTPKGRSFPGFRDSTANRHDRGYAQARKGRILSEWASSEGVSSAALIQRHLRRDPVLWQLFRNNSATQYYSYPEMAHLIKMKLAAGVELGAWTQRAVARALAVAQYTVWNYSANACGHDSAVVALRDYYYDESLYADYVQKCLDVPLRQNGPFEKEHAQSFTCRRRAREKFLNRHARRLGHQIIDGREYVRFDFDDLGGFTTLAPAYEANRIST